MMKTKLQLLNLTGRRQNYPTTQPTNRPTNQTIFHLLFRRSSEDKKKVGSCSVWLSELYTLYCFYSFFTDAKKSSIRKEYE